MREYKFRVLDLLKHSYKNGIKAGLQLWINNLSGGKMIKAGLRNMPAPVQLRRDTSDVEAFKQVFIWEEYNYPVQGEVKVIVDAGANIGCSTLWFMQRYPAATIVAIEPEAANFALLQANIKAYAKASAGQYGIWSRQCGLMIENSAAESWNFTLREAAAGEKGVPSLSIQDIIEQHNFDRIDILKIDIEGTEREIFSNDSYKTWLPKVRYIFIETHDFMYADCAKTVTAAIFQFNFSMYTCGENLVFVNNESGIGNG